MLRQLHVLFCRGNTISCCSLFQTCQQLRWTKAILQYQNVVSSPFLFYIFDFSLFSSTSSPLKINKFVTSSRVCKRQMSEHDCTRRLLAGDKTHNYELYKLKRLSSVLKYLHDQRMEIKE